MLKLGPASTIAPTTKSRIFIIDKGGIRNSIFSNQLLKTADLQKIIKNLEFTRTENHHIISSHVDQLFPVTYDVESQTKFSLAASKLSAVYQEEVEDSIEEIDDEIKDMIKLRDKSVSSGSPIPTPSSPTPSTKLANLLGRSPKTFDEEELKKLLLRKSKLNDVINSNDLTIYDKYIYVNKQTLDADDDFDNNESFKFIGTLIAGLAILNRAVNPLTQVDLQVGDILVYTGENSFSVKIIDITDKFQYYPIAYFKNQGLIINSSGLDSIYLADRFVGTVIPTIDTQKISGKIPNFIDLLLEDD